MNNVTEAADNSRPRRRRKPGVPSNAPKLAPAVTVHTRVTAALTQLGETFAEREEPLKCMAVALLTGMNYLLVGPRGTAKTAMATCLMKHVDGSRHFNTLLGSFSTLNDLVGRIDLAALQRGEERRKIEGKMLDCDTAFLDEALKGSDGVLNSMLGLLSDNRDFDGSECDLWSVGSATNWPEVNRRTDRISALYDRFHIKVPVTAVSSREGRVAVLRASRTLSQYAPKEGTIITVDELRSAADEVALVTIDPMVEDLMCSVQERCIKEGIDISDRKLAQWQRGLQACAWLDGRDAVGIQDFGVLIYMAWDNEKDIAKAKSIIDSCDRELVKELIGKVDEARQAYESAKSAGLNAEKAGRVLDVIIKTAEYVGSAMKKYKDGMRPESKKDISRAIGQLNTDFEQLYAKFKPALDAEESK